MEKRSAKIIGDVLAALKREGIKPTHNKSVTYGTEVTFWGDNATDVPDQWSYDHRYIEVYTRSGGVNDEISVRTWPSDDTVNRTWNLRKRGESEDAAITDKIVGYVMARSRLTGKTRPLARFYPDGRLPEPAKEKDYRGFLDWLEKFTEKLEGDFGIYTVNGHVSLWLRNAGNVRKVVAKAAECGLSVDDMNANAGDNILMIGDEDTKEIMKLKGVSESKRLPRRLPLL